MRVADAGPAGALRAVGWLVVAAGVVAAIGIGLVGANPLPAAFILAQAVVVGLLLIVLGAIGTNVARIVTTLHELRAELRAEGGSPGDGDVVP